MITRKRFAVLSLIFLLLTTAQAQFNQKGIVKEYNRREQKTFFKFPVEIVVKGASSTLSNSNGSFNLLFPTGHVGDTLSAFRITPVNHQYTLFNAPKIQDWVLTPSRSLEVLVCNKSIIDDVQKTYTTNYVNALTAQYQKQKAQLEQKLKDEKASGKAARAEIERLDENLAKLKEQYKKDSLDIVSRSVVFAYVDETELDSLELRWRDCILAGDFKEAVRIGEEMKLGELSTTRLENLNKSVDAAQEQLEATLQTARILEQHIVNLENLAYGGSEPLWGYSRWFAEQNGPYYESLTALYGRLYELYTTKFRCTDSFLQDLREKYAHSLYRYAEVCQRTWGGLNKPSGYTDEGIAGLKKAAQLDHYDALLALSEIASLPYEQRRLFTKQARALIDNDETRKKDWLLVDFAVVANGDTLYCHKLDAPSEVEQYGEHAVMLCSVHPSDKGQVLVVPPSVDYDGTKHFIKVLGKKSCNGAKAVLFDFSAPYIYPEDIVPATHGSITSKSELVISNGIALLGENSIGSWFEKISIPQSVTEIMHSAISSNKRIDVKLAKKANYVLKDGILYSRDLQRIAAFVDPTIKEIRVAKDFKFTDDLFGFLHSIAFPDSLERFVVDPENPFYTTVNGMLIDKQKDSLLCVPKNVPFFTLDERTLPLIQYAAKFVNGKVSTTYKYRTAYQIPKNKRYQVACFADSISISKVFDYFMSIYMGSYGDPQVAITNSDGEVKDILAFVESLMPHVSVERLTFWGRTGVKDKVLERQELGLRMLEYAKEKYGELKTDEEYSDSKILLKLLPFSRYQDYTAYNKECAQNSIKALALDPGYNYEASIAEHLHAIGDFSAALQYIDAAIQKDSVSASHLLTKSDILFDTGRYDDAIATVSQYIAKNNNDYYGYYRRAFFYNNLGQIDHAIEDYSIAIKKNPSNAYAYLGRGDMYRAKGDTLLAERDYKEVLNRLNYGENRCDQYAYCMMGNHAKAKSITDNLIKSCPNTPGIYYDAACLYARMGEYAASLDYLKTALEKGCRRYGLLLTDDDLDPIRKTEEFKHLIHQYFAYMHPTL